MKKQEFDKLSNQFRNLHYMQQYSQYAYGSNI